MDMVGSKHSGNPNVVIDTKGKSTGPKTETGKLITSMSKITSVVARKNRTSSRLSENSRIGTLMKDAGLDFSKVEENLKKINIFKIFLQSKTDKDITEIKRLESIINLLESDLATRFVNTIEVGTPLDEQDLKLIKLLKEVIVESHRLKFGDKRLNVNATYQDIRELMMQQ